MTVETLHDAIGLLPADLLLETDRKRSHVPKVIQWKRWAAMAACIALILYCGTLFRSGLFAGGSKSTAMESIVEAQAPAAPAEAAPTQAAAMIETQAAAEEAADSSSAEVPATGTENGAEEALCIDHAHHPAEETEPRNTAGAYCGLTTATIYIGGESHTISGADAVALTDILLHLDFSSDNLCRCVAEYTADTETETGYQISLTNYFVRHSDTQAPLTEDQAETIRAILDALED